MAARKKKSGQNKAKTGDTINNPPPIKKVNQCPDCPHDEHPLSKCPDCECLTVRARGGGHRQLGDYDG